MRREHIHDTVDGLRRIRRVQGRKHEVTRLRECQSERDALEIAHLANHHEVRILTEHMLEAFRKRDEVAPEFALTDEALLRIEEELDRIFERDDVDRRFGEQLLDDGSQRRRFARSGRTGEEDKTVHPAAEIEHDVWNRQFVDRWDCLRDDTCGKRRRTGSTVAVNSETGAIRKAVGTVDVSRRLERFKLGIREKFLHERNVFCIR